MSADPGASEKLEYRPLDSGTNELRVLALLEPRPQSWVSKFLRSDIVECRMEYVSLDDYSAAFSEFLHNHNHTTKWVWGDLMALSYEWGDMSNTRDVIVDGKRIRVSRNLEDALRSLRRALGRGLNMGRKTFVWVDSVCINQGDVPERNAQVKRMKDIYAQATRVLVWTGPRLKSVKKFTRYIDEAASRIVTANPSGTSPTASPILRRGIVELVSRTYWERLWVIQEMLLARGNSSVFFGDENCPLARLFFVIARYLADANQFLREFTYDANRQKEIVARLTRMENLLALKYFRHRGRPRVELPLVLQASRQSKQKDHRDKVYAILGLVDPNIQALVAPDYNASILEVYRGFARAVIKATRSLDIIFQGASSFVRNTEFPSWVPDWTLDPRDDIISSTQYMESRAAGDTTHHFFESDSLDLLTCRGVRVGGIESLSCSIDVGNPHTRHDLLTAATITTTASPNPYRDDGGMKDAVLGTLAMSMVSSLDPKVAVFLRNMPWFNGRAAAQRVPLYDIIDSFQQCNKGLNIAGKPLEGYFARWTPAFTMPPTNSRVYFLLSEIMNPLHYRRLVTTSEGYIGMAPKRTQLMDQIFVLEGCNVPLVLRPAGGDRYEVVGECYLHGMMMGEALNAVGERNIGTEIVTLC